jgi:hypothetical protein
MGDQVLKTARHIEMELIPDAARRYLRGELTADEYFTSKVNASTADPRRARRGSTSPAVTTSGDSAIEVDDGTY